MRNLHPATFETNNPRSCVGNTGLSDRDELQAWQDQQQIADRFDEAFLGVAPIIQPARQLSVQETSDADSDFLDLVGSAKLNAIIDAAYKGNAAVALMIMELHDHREVYRQQFASDVA